MILSGTVYQLEAGQLKQNRPLAVWVAKLVHHAFDASAGWTWRTETALQMLEAFRVINVQLLDAQEKAILDNDLEYMAKLLINLAPFAKLSAQWKPHALGRMTSRLMTALRDPANSERRRKLIVDALMRIGLPNPEFVEYLIQGLRSDALKERLQSFSVLIALGVKHPRMVDYLSEVLTRGSNKLAELDNVYGSNVTGAHNDYDALINEAQVAIDAIASEKKYTINNKKLSQAMYELIKTYKAKTRSLWNDYDVGLMIGVAVRMGADLKSFTGEMPYRK